MDPTCVPSTMALRPSWTASTPMLTGKGLWTQTVWQAGRHPQRLQRTRMTRIMTWKMILVIPLTMTTGYWHRPIRSRWWILRVLARGFDQFASGMQPKILCLPWSTQTAFTFSKQSSANALDTGCRTGRFLLLVYTPAPNSALKLSSPPRSSTNVSLIKLNVIRLLETSTTNSRG